MLILIGTGMGREGKRTNSLQRWGTGWGRGWSVGGGLMKGLYMMRSRELEALIHACLLMLMKDGYEYRDALEVIVQALYPVTIDEVEENEEVLLLQ